MKKFIKLFTTLFAVCTLVFLAACQKPAEPAPVEPTKYTAQEMADAVQFEYDQKDVTFDIALTEKVERTLEGSDEVQTETITWTSEDARITINGYIATFTYDEAKKAEPAIITANVTIGEDKGSSNFKLRVNKESNYDEFMAAKNDTGLAIAGYVAYKGEFKPASKKPEKNPGIASLILTDRSGSKYFYSHQTNILASVYENLEIGQFVGITGKKSIFKGCHQVKGELVKLPGDKKVPTATPIEFTDANLDTKDFVLNNSYAPATATLFVTENPVDYKNEQRKVEVKAKINDMNGTKDVYLCNYDYLFNFDKEHPENNSQALKDVHKALMDLKPGDTVKVEGFFAAYNGTTAFYVNDSTKLTVTDNNPDYALVVDEVNRLAKVLDDAKTTVEGTYDLTPGADFTVEVALSDTTLTQFAYDEATHKFTITPDKTKVTVTVTLKVTKGNVSLTKKVSLSVQEVVVMPETIIQTIVATNPNQPDADGKYAQYKLKVDGVNEAKIFGLDETIWTVTSSKDYKGEGVAISYANQLRLYSDRDGKVGHKLTFTSTNVEFQYVRLTMNNDPKKPAPTFTINGEVVENVVKGTITVKLPKKVKELVIHNSATSGQVRIEKIELA